MLKCNFCKAPLPDCPHCRGPTSKHYEGQKWYCSRECLHAMRAKNGKEPIPDSKIVVPVDIPT